MMIFAKKILGLCLLVLSLTATSPVLAGMEDNLSEKQRQEIEKIIHQYIMDNPRVILDAVARLQAREEASKEEQAKATLTSSREILNNDPDSPVGGNPNGDVTIVEFFDYRCGYCKKVHPSVKKIIESDKNVRFVYKEFPILGPQSVTATKAALAVSRIDASKYQTYHDILMTARGSLTKSQVLKLAAEAGIDANAVAKEMDSPEIEKIIRKNYDLAQSLNINGTPAFVIGNELIPGAADYATLKNLISKARGS